MLIISKLMCEEILNQWKRPAASSQTASQGKIEQRHVARILSHTWDMSMAAASATSERTHTYTWTRCGMLNYRHRFSFINLLQRSNALFFTLRLFLTRPHTRFLLALQLELRRHFVRAHINYVAVIHRPQSTSAIIILSAQHRKLMIISLFWRAFSFLSFTLSFAPRFSPCYITIRCK